MHAYIHFIDCVTVTYSYGFLINNNNYYYYNIIMNMSCFCSRGLYATVTAVVVGAVIFTFTTAVVVAAMVITMATAVVVVVVVAVKSQRTNRNSIRVTITTNRTHLHKHTITISNNNNNNNNDSVVSLTCTQYNSTASATAVITVCKYCRGTIPFCFCSKYKLYNNNNKCTSTCSDGQRNEVILTLTTQKQTQLQQKNNTFTAIVATSNLKNVSAFIRNHFP